MRPHLVFSAFELTIMLAGLLAAVETHTGQVISAGKGRITIIQAQDKQMSFDVAENATVLLDSKPATLEKLTIGDQATLQVETRNSKPVVTLVDAKSAADKSTDPLPSG